MTFLHGRDTQLLIFTVSIFLFGTLWIDMAQSYLPSEADRDVLSFMAHNRYEVITGVLATFSFLGSSIPITVFALTVAAVIGLRAHAWQPMALVIVTVVGVPLLNQVIKHEVDRPRPADHYQVMNAGGYSFPSAHSMNSAAILGVAAFLIYSATRSTRIRHWTVLLTAGFILGVAVSRLYLGAHWLTDVVGGLALGLVCLLVLSWIFHRIVPKDALYSDTDKTVTFLKVRTARFRAAKVRAAA